MKKIFRIIVSMCVVITMLTAITAPAFAATTVEVISGKVSITDSQNTGSGDATKYTATVTGGSLLANTNKISIANESDKRAKISFDYSAEGSSSFSIDGSSALSGSYSAILEAGGTTGQIISIKAARKTTATLTLSNITYSEIAAESNVTVEFDDSMGTVTVDGASMQTGNSVVVGESGKVFKATAIDGATFVAWVDETGYIKSRSAEYTQASDGDMTLKALFYKNSEPFFIVDDKYILSDLNEAAENGSKIVLMYDAVLPAGNYTIPSGKTLLIPFDAANTIYTDAPSAINANYFFGGESYSTPSAYRTLTMQSGANITVNGSLNLSAKHYAGDTHGGDGGAPTGNVSFIRMNENSSITVNSGGSLYAWGYIIGNGNVVAKSGAKVYEYFQFTDFRGGTLTSLMAEGDAKNYGIFPLSQYYVQNIEVPLTIEAGAVESTYTSIIVSRIIQGSGVSFFGDGVNSVGMFNLSSGYVTKRYDGTRDRLIVDLNGKMTVDPVKLSIGTYNIDSSAYELPISNNITINVNEGSEVIINQNICLLPGAEIRIDENAAGKLKSGVSAYVYDSDEWGTYCYSSGNKKFKALGYVPGRTYTRTEADLVDGAVILNGTFDASEGYVYTTQSGANISSEGLGTVKMQAGLETITYQVIENGTEPENSEYVPISVTTAKLKNSNGEYLEYDGKHTEFVYSNGVWEPKHNIVTHGAQPATCEEVGWNAYEECSLCDYSTYSEIPALGHNYENYICTVCGNEKIATSTSYSIDDGKVIINSRLIEDVLPTSLILIAVYDSSDKLLNSKPYLANSLDEVTFDSENVYKIKVFSWDGFGTIKPLAMVEEIMLQ